MISGETTKNGDENRSFKNVIYNGINNQDLKISEIDDNYVLMELCVTKVLYNNKPIILSTIGIPDTDFFDFVLLFWDNDKYSIGRKTIEY